jgi:hypothetical protein
MISAWELSAQVGRAMERLVDVSKIVDQEPERIGLGTFLRTVRRA